MSATGPETGSSSTAPAVPFFKKKTRPTTSRKRDTSPSTTAANTTTAASDPILSRIPNGGSEVIVPTRKTVANPLIQGTKRTLSQRDDSASLDDHLGPDVKWKASGSTLSAVEREREALSAEEERSLVKKARREAEDEEREDDGLYHGATSYKSHIKKREDGVPKAMRVGPQKSTSTIRTVTVIDYQPDVCKDYKGVLWPGLFGLHISNLRSHDTRTTETGYCGFGDTCKFLHDRGTCTLLSPLLL
jgi:RING finger protein 113A